MEFDDKDTKTSRKENATTPRKLTLRNEKVRKYDQCCNNAEKLTQWSLIVHSALCQSGPQKSLWHSECLR